VEELGFPVVFGNALQERILQRAGFGAVETAVALTGNKTLNGVFVNRAKEVFGVPKGLVAATEIDGGLVGELVDRQEADVIFDAHHDIDRWDPRWRSGEVETIRCRYENTGEGASRGTEDTNRVAGSGERYVILTVERNGFARPMSMGLSPREADLATVAIHIPERRDALEALASLGWRPVTHDGAEGEERRTETHGENS
jgi:voltage-gated potassium channel Kch